MEFAIRKEIQNKMLEKIALLEYKDTSETVFDGVVKYPVDIFSSFLASVQFGPRGEVERNQSYTLQQVGFTVVFGQLISTNDDPDTDLVSQDLLDVKTDLLADAEDRLYNHFEMVDDGNYAYSGEFSNFQLVDIRNLNCVPFVQEGNRGIELTMNFDVDFIINIPFKQLT